MSIHRRAARRDANEPIVIDTLQRLGFSVHRISARGIPDLLLSKGGAQAVAEVKTASGRLTSDQVAFWREWRGHAPLILRTPDDAVALAQRWPSVD